MYTLLKKTEIIFGPVDWSPIDFQKKLYEQSINISLPLNPPESTLNIGNDFFIYPTEVNVASPYYDEKKINNGTYSIIKNKLIYSEQITKLTDEEKQIKFNKKKEELLLSIKQKRQQQESAGIKIQLNDIDCYFSTDRESQGLLHRTYSFMTEPVNWKLKDNTWIILNKDEVLSVIKKITEYVEDCFHKEQSLSIKIESLNFDQLFLFELVSEWEDA